MEIRKSKETLILTQTEKAILAEAFTILDNICNECEKYGSIENYAYKAQESIEDLLEDAEVENGEPKGVINVTIVM